MRSYSCAVNLIGLVQPVGLASALTPSARVERRAELRTAETVDAVLFRRVLATARVVPPPFGPFSLPPSFRRLFPIPPDVCELSLERET